MSDPLDQMIEATCAALGITPDASWLPSIRQNLEVSLRLARLVDDFALPDEAEPAPVFRA